MKYLLVTKARAITSAALITAALPTFVTARRIWSAFPGSMLTANHATVLQDYIVMWVSGRIALMGNLPALATIQGFNHQIASLVGPGIDQYTWFYPPHMLLLSVPLALVSPFTGFTIWTLSTLALLWLAMRCAGISTLGAAVVLLSPAALENAVDGQNGALLTGSMVGGLALAGRRPWLAGLFVSLLTLKPQLAIVVPVCLMASRCWKALLWAVLFASLWLAVSVACFGVGPWWDYVTSVMPEAAALHLGLDTVPFGTLYLQNLVVTPFAAVRAAGGAPFLAQVIQTCIAVGVLGLVWRIWSKASPPAPHLRLALALSAVPLVTPYAMTYDMIGPALACVLLSTYASSSRFVFYAVALAWLWPGVSIYVGAGYGVPGLGAVAFGLLCAVAWVKARDGKAEAPQYGLSLPA